MLEGPKFDMHALGNHHNNNNYDAFTQDFYQKLGEEGTNMSMDIVCRQVIPEGLNLCSPRKSIGSSTKLRTGLSLPIGVVRGAEILPMLLKVFNHTFKKRITAHRLCIADHTTLSSSASHSHVHSPLVL